MRLLGIVFSVHSDMVYVVLAIKLNLNFINSTNCIVLVISKLIIEINNLNDEHL